MADDWNDDIQMMRELAELPTLAAMHGVWKYQKEYIKSHFESGNAERFGWPPLSPKYQRRKQREHGSKPMLVATGKLRNAVVGRGKVQASGNMIRITWRSLPKYAKYVDVDRPYLYPDQHDMKKIDKSAQEYINKVSKKGGSKPTSPFKEI